MPRAIRAVGRVLPIPVLGPAPSLRSDLISDRDRLRSQVEFRSDLARDPPRDRRDPLLSWRQKHRTPVGVIWRSAARFDDRDADATTFLMFAEPVEDETLELLTRFQLPGHGSVIPALFGIFVNWRNLLAWRPGTRKKDPSGYKILRAPWQAPSRALAAQQRLSPLAQSLDQGVRAAAPRQN
jgi:hypothetical protein